MTFDIKSLVQAVRYKINKEAKIAEISHPISPQLMIPPKKVSKKRIQNPANSIKYLSPLSMVSPRDKRVKD